MLEGICSCHLGYWIEGRWVWVPSSVFSPSQGIYNLPIFLRSLLANLRVDVLCHLRGRGLICLILYQPSEQEIEDNPVIWLYVHDKEPCKMVHPPTMHVQSIVLFKGNVKKILGFIKICKAYISLRYYEIKHRKWWEMKWFLDSVIRTVLVRPFIVWSHLILFNTEDNGRCKINPAKWMVEMKHQILSLLKIHMNLSIIISHFLLLIMKICNHLLLDLLGFPS